MRQLNTAGPCIPGRHYVLEPTARLAAARSLIQDMSRLSATSVSRRERSCPPDLRPPEPCPEIDEGLGILSGVLAACPRHSPRPLVLSLDEPAAAARASELTGGQPWRVNALAREIGEKLVGDPDRPDGTLDRRRLLEEFAAFWTEHRDVLEARVPYHEVAPQLVLMAFLQRVVDGGGRQARPARARAAAARRAPDAPRPRPRHARAVRPAQRRPAARALHLVRGGDHPERPSGSGPARLTAGPEPHRPCPPPRLPVLPEPWHAACVTRPRHAGRRAGEGAR